MNYADAINLWQAMIAYANACRELGEEGNSGEFHCDKWEKRLIENLRCREEELIEQFAGATGWKPVKFCSNMCDYEYDWELEAINSDSGK